MVGAGELALGTVRIVTLQLVGAVATVVLVVTLPRLEDASAVAAAELGGTARVERCRTRPPLGVTERSDGRLKVTTFLFPTHVDLRLICPGIKMFFFLLN